MKDKIENTLIELLNDCPFNKITVKDIVENCHVSRQTFYYYFKDIYSVLVSIFQKRTESAARELSTVNDWKFGYIKFLEWGIEHKNYVENVFSSISRDVLEEYLGRLLYVHMEWNVSHRAAGMNVTREQIEYISNFYTTALTANYFNWLANGMPNDPRDETRMLDIVLKGNVDKALRDFEKYNETE